MIEPDSDPAHEGPTGGAMTFEAYSLKGAYVHRLFLPMVSMEDDPIGPAETSPWAPLARDAGVDLDARTEWALVLGWGRGDGQAPPFRPALGRAPRHTLEAIRRLLSTEAPVDDHLWRLDPFESLAGYEKVSGRRFSTDLDTFFGVWQEGPMPGALSLGDEILLAAPRYADSVIVSAPQDLTIAGTGLGLEIVRAARSSALPGMTW